MVFGRVERREVEPVAFNFRPLGNLKPHAAKNIFNALQGQRHGVQSPCPTDTPGQRHVQRLGLKLRLKLRIGQLLAALGQRGFNRLLGLIDGCTSGFFLFYRKLRHVFHQRSDAARLAQEASLGIFQIVGGVGLRKFFTRRSD